MCIPSTLMTGMNSKSSKKMSKAPVLATNLIVSINSAKLVKHSMDMSYGYPCGNGNAATKTVPRSLTLSKCSIIAPDMASCTTFAKRESSPPSTLMALKDYGAGASKISLRASTGEEPYWRWDMD